MRRHFHLPVAGINVDVCLSAGGAGGSGCVRLQCRTCRRPIAARANAFYFSFITLCTVGYGDITPVFDVARMLAAMEAITGTLYVAVLISRLVALYSSEKLQSGAQKH